jgi:hypothetical protein
VVVSTGLVVGWLRQRFTSGKLFAIMTGKKHFPLWRKRPGYNRFMVLRNFYVKRPYKAMFDVTQIDITNTAVLKKGFTLYVNHKVHYWRSMKFFCIFWNDNLVGIWVRSCFRHITMPHNNITYVDGGSFHYYNLKLSGAWSLLNFFVKKRGPRFQDVFWKSPLFSSSLGLPFF